MHTKQESEGGLDMTTHEKAQLIKFANYCEQIADSDRKASRKWDTQYCAGWLAGAGNARRDVANELRQFIEVMEIVETT